MNISIRKAQKEDASQIAELFMLAWPVEDIMNSNITLNTNLMLQTSHLVSQINVCKDIRIYNLIKIEINAALISANFYICKDLIF